jgi:molybdate transport system substrate-binding protein
MFLDSTATGTLNMVQGNEVKVMQSAAFREAYLELAPRFERESGHKLSTLWVPSVQMMNRLKGGEIVDVVILSAASLDELVAAGMIARESKVDLARSGVGVAVRSGAPKPDISSAEAVKRAVLEAKGIAYSTGPSGIYLASLFERWGIAEQLKPKLKRVQGEPAGGVVGRGEAELAFQQVSELLPVAGIDVVGPLPPDIQKITVFSAGIHAKAPQPDAAGALIRFLSSPAAAPVIRTKGMDPV